MKILILTAYDQPDRFQTRSFDYAEELLNLGHEITVFASSYCHFSKKDRLSGREKYKLENINGVKTYWVKTTPYEGNGISRGLNMFYMFFRSLHLSKKIDKNFDAVIGTSSPPLISYAAYLISKRKKASFVHDIRDVWPDSLVSLGALSEWNPVYIFFKLLEIFIYKKAHKISSALPYVSKQVEKYGGSKSDISYIPTGISFKKITKPVFKHKEISKNIKVMYLGGFARVHDIESIIKASEILIDKGYKNFDFILIGYGKEKEKYKKHIIESKNFSVEFRDSVEKNDVIPTLRTADILISAIVDLPVTKWGSNPTKLYDYMSSGIPVVCSFNSPNLPILDADCGYSVEANSPQKIAECLIEFSLLEKEERFKMGLKGFEYAFKNYNLQTLAKSLEKTIEGSIKKKIALEKNE